MRLVSAFLIGKSLPHLFLPGAEEATIAALEKTIGELEPVTTMLNKGMTPEDILGQVCGSLGVAFLETTEVTYKCYCTRERVERALISLGRKELEEIRQEGKVFSEEYTPDGILADALVHIRVLHKVAPYQIS